MSRTPRAVQVPGETPAAATQATVQAVQAAAQGDGSTSEVEMLRAQLAKEQAAREAAEAAARQALEQASASRPVAQAVRVVEARGEAQLTERGWVIPATYGSPKKV